MEKLIKSILASVAVYFILTLPHFIYFQTFGKSGFEMSPILLMILGGVSGFLGPILSKRFL